MLRKTVCVIVITLILTLASVAQDMLVRGAVSLQIGVDQRALSQIDTDAMVIPVFAGEDPSTTLFQGAAAELSAAIKAAVAQKAVSGDLYSEASIFAPGGFATRRLYLIGAGAGSAFDAERLRRLAGVAMQKLREQNVTSLTFLARGRLQSNVAARAITEGAILGLFDAGIHKSDKQPVALKSLHIAGLEGSTATLKSAIERAETFAHAQNFARSITVEPANFITPEVMAAHARRIAREGGLEAEIFDERRMAELGLGGVIAVGKGSANPPRFIVLRYRPARASSTTLALVGKGVCFDSGGISLKPGENMYRMKGDMAGGAAVLAAMQIIARLKPEISVIGIVPAVENMPSGTAQKPGDVFKNLSGRTVEVFSTDAEGRLILSDGVSYAVRQGATHIIDIATLTGSIRTALGSAHVGAFASDDKLFDNLVAASRLTGESFWRMPIDEEYAGQIRSSLVADLNESGGQAGASVGAKFIEHFAEGRPWIHLDIAGTSWPEPAPPHLGPGPTGVTVRTLAELAVLLGTGTGQGSSPARRD